MKKLIANRLDAVGHHLTDAELESVSLMMTELKKWNKTINLTAIESDEEIIAKHIIDSLFLLPLVVDSDSWLDVGSGAGFPGIPLQILRPANSITTVDAVRKKIMFQKHLARCLKLNNFHSIHSRVEEMYLKYSNSFDVVVSRAFANLELFVKLVYPLLKPGGRIVAMKGAFADEEMKKSEQGLKELNMCISTVKKYQLPENYGKRHIIIITACN